jgi:hypothetical protein
MKKAFFLTLTMLVLIFFTCGPFLCAADAGQTRAYDVQSQKVHPPRETGAKPFYGYVPPPPIRHTWPGGYKAIFLELTNTLTDHILGRY